MGVLLAALLVLAGLVWFGGLGDRYLDWRYDRIFAAIDRSEAVITVLSRDATPMLTKGAMNLEVPGSGGVALFASRVRFNDLARTGPEARGGIAHLGLRFADLPIAEEHGDSTPEELRLWRPFLDRVDYFHHAKFYVIDGEFADDAETRFETKTGFKGLATLTDGRQVYARGKLKLEWQEHPPEPGKEERSWRIDGFFVKNFELQEASQLLFDEVLDHALPDAESLARARRSLHEELVLEQFLDKGKGKFKPPHKYFSWPAFDRHPGVSVVDLDRDGFDDFYLVERHGRNMFFRNRGDGSFEEIASEVGLDLRGHTASTIFADFDNDGDTDAFLGRTLEPSAYFENVDGRFENRTVSRVAGDLPFHVSSVSAVDYDRDGLLDVYFSTYASQIILVHGVRELRRFLSEEQTAELVRRQREADAHKIKNRPGPPNVLVRNLGGGRFQVVDAAPLEVWHNTYQSTWADYDGDGDMDVYVANDFAPNNLVRNDGDGRFTDVTEESQTADIGFGMGAAWGDYDNDGHQDLYVTNMFSKAGRRITAKAGAIGDEFAPMAYGNSLLRRGGDGAFERVSGLERPSLMVSEAGWGWGGQFADFDNDGYLDIFALSGFYTTPRQVEIAEDT